MSAALELIQTVRSNGGRMRVEGDELVIAPDSAALPIIEELRQHKGEIIRLLVPDVPDSSPGPARDQSAPIHDPAAWSEDFHRWALDRCVYRDRSFGGFRCLLSDFGEWAIMHDSVPCTWETFEALLHDAGFLTGEVSGMLQVSGLILKDDIWALEARPAEG